MQQHLLSSTPLQRPGGSYHFRSTGKLLDGWDSFVALPLQLLSKTRRMCLKPAEPSKGTVPLPTWSP